MTNQQAAPYPTELQAIVKGLTYRPNWSFDIGDVDRGQGCQGLTVTIHVLEADPQYSEKLVHVVHYMPVPPAAYNRQSWLRWMFDQIGLVESHERGEFFRVDGEQPFPPNHEDGNDPYPRA